MCGIVGMVASGEVGQDLYDGLTMLQHRGQDAAGMVTCDGSHLVMVKGEGLVRDAFRAEDMLRLRGRVGIGHVRYPTAGCSGPDEAQPFYVNSPFGICLAHNGNIINAAALKDSLFLEDRRHINTQSDSELLLNVLAQELDRVSRGRMGLAVEDCVAAVAALHGRCCGAYSAVALVVGFGLIAFRDPHGIRPLVWGRRGDAVMVASETVALECLGFGEIRPIAPGEVLVVSSAGVAQSIQVVPTRSWSLDLFEYVYLARPDSVLDGVSVHEARIRMGRFLAEKILRCGQHQGIDVVIPVPDTSQPCAVELARTLGVPYREGFVKNRYIGRTFIMPGQKVRSRSVRHKLNPIVSEFRNRHVLLVDDSIVRGTTSKEIIRMAYQAGASQVSFASAAPPVRYPDLYGIDLPCSDELIAHGRTDEEIAQALGAARLFYQDLPDLHRAILESNPTLGPLEDACFSGEYITGIPDPTYLHALAQARSDNARASWPQQRPGPSGGESTASTAKLAGAVHS